MSRLPEKVDDRYRELLVYLAGGFGIVDLDAVVLRHQAEYRINFVSRVHCHFIAEPS